MALTIPSTPFARELPWQISKKLMTISTLAILLGTAAACGAGTGEPIPSGPASTSGEGTTSSSGGVGSSGGVSSSGGAAPSSSGSTPSSESAVCPDVSGSWKGPVEGDDLAGGLFGDRTSKVDGTAAVELSASAKDEHSISVTSKLDVKTRDDLLGGLLSRQRLTGTVKCGKLEGTTEGTLDGQPLRGTVKCTMTHEGCQGTWTAADMGGATVIANGTFKLAR